MRVISEQDNEDNQKSYANLSKNEFSNPNLPSLKSLKKPNDHKAEASPNLKNNEEDMLDKALEQIEKENLPLTYEVNIYFNKEFL